MQGLVIKKNLKRDPDAQTLEDTLCLVFLEKQFSAFAQKEADKIVAIVRKTWPKMSAEGQTAALGLPLSKTDLAIIEQALGFSKTKHASKSAKHTALLCVRRRPEYNPALRTAFVKRGVSPKNMGCHLSP